MDLIIPEDKFIPVIVRDRNGILYEGKADAVSSLNERGEFDVLPLHANFISLIRSKLTITQKGNTIKEIALGAGVLAVRENGVEVYIGILR